MSYGYRGKILHVDLTNRKMEVEEKDDTFYRTYLGGRGIGYYYLLKEVPPRIDPLSPENILTLATGVMTGSPLPASCRFSAIGKSPLTGAAGESEAGGFFGPELKMAGLDALVLRGRSEKPIYLWIVDGKAEIRNASHLVRLGTREVQDAIRAEIGSKKIRVAQTGLAGMNLVRYANITNNLGHFNGRNGFGALMGSKNIRAIAVLGNGEIPFYDLQFLRQFAQDYSKEFKGMEWERGLHTYGTSAICLLLSEMGGLPVNNFRRSKLEDPQSMSGDAYNEILLKERKGCYACPIRCKPVIALEDSKYGVDSSYGGPEYETIAALGTNLNIFDLKAIAKGNEICNRYCMDTISAGMTIAFAWECFEEGIIAKEDTGNLEFRFGDADMMIRLLEMIAKREGFGDLLAEGVGRIAHKWGATNYPGYLAVKGQEIPMHDPRVKVGVGIGYAVSTYGADHMNVPHDGNFVDEKFSTFQSVKPLGIYRSMGPTEIDIEKVRTYPILHALWMMENALGLCLFAYPPRGSISLDEMVQCLKAVTGWNASLFELMKAGERGTVMARAFNSREGFNIQDDKLPRRLFGAVSDGPNAGRKIFIEEDFRKATELLYELMGCDPYTGRPLKGKMIELGLEWVYRLLQSY